VAANTPLECLLEDCDIDLILYYVSPDGALTEPVPAHDALIVAMSAMDQPLLAALAPILAHWPRPVINAPQHIPATERATASRLLQNVPGLLMPPTVPAPRSALLAAAINAAAQCAGIAFPLIVRPLDSQAGRDLAQLASAEALIPYLAQVADADFFVSPFIDYRGADGLFRKFRIALIDGAAFACHMAVSSHWMIHYVNAGMYDEAAKRAEEAAFMEDFPRFAARHAHALAAIQQRAGLDYLCIDCAETPDGQLLIFEIDHVMVVHAMDTAELFPYKQVHMLKVRQAFREFVLRLSAAATTAGGAR
jgi:glutathione synthase/RimK-type ligase-like ATP-grasp enzyme